MARDNGHTDADRSSSLDDSALDTLLTADDSAVWQSLQPLEPRIMLSATIEGAVFHDSDADGTFDAGEQGLGGWFVYVDSDNNGVRDGGEFAAVTNDQGEYALRNLTAGTHTLRVDPPDGWSGPASPTQVNVGDGQTVAGVEIAAQQIVDGAIVAYATDFEPSPLEQFEVYDVDEATLGGGTVLESNHQGYHGSGFANFPASGGYAEWTGVDGGNGGTASVTFRYALGVGSSRTASLVVNGVAQNVTFMPTGGWSNWSTVTATVQLNAGQTNTIRVQTTGQDAGNIDTITVSTSQSGNSQYTADGVQAIWSTTSSNPPIRQSFTPNGHGFLGDFSAQSVQLSLSDLPQHERLAVSFDLYLIRSWDGDWTDNGPTVPTSGGSRSMGRRCWTKPSAICPLTLTPRALGARTNPPAPIRPAPAAYATCWGIHSTTTSSRRAPTRPTASTPSRLPSITPATPRSSISSRPRFRCWGMRVGVWTT